MPLGCPLEPHELEVCEATALLTFYYRFYSQMSDAAFDVARGKALWAFYREFSAAFKELYAVPVILPGGYTPAKIFTLYVLIARAFLRIFENVLGASKPAGRLRAAIWESLFTYDLRRYGRSLCEQLGEFATLISGPSGTGKEVVARTIAGCRFQTFDQKTQKFSL